MLPENKISTHLSCNRLAAFLVCILSVLSCHSQTDSLYIRPYGQELSVRPHMYYKFTSLTHEIDDNNDLTYMPNSPLGLGIGITYKDYSVSLGYGFKFMRDKEKGDTKSLDFQYHYYGRKFVADIFFQRYKGFYTEEKEEVYEIFPDIKITQYGMYGQYIFNNRKFSYKAAFNQSEEQLRSTGSWLVGGGIYYNRIESDSTLYLYEHNKLKNYQLGISGGYAYTWVINRHVYLSGSMTMGISFGTQNINNFDKVEVSPSMFPRFSAGYNADNWAVSLSGVVNRIYVTHTNSLKMLFNTGTIQVSFIKRFETAPKFIKTVKFIN